MKKLPGLSLLLLLSVFSLSAQKKSGLLFEVGGEGGLTSDYLTVNDPGNKLLRGTLLFSGTGGPKIRVYLDKKIFIETAFMFKENTFGFSFDKDRGSWSTNASEIFFIPIRLGYEWKLSSKMALNAIAGIVPSFITRHGGSTGNGTQNPGAIAYSYQMRQAYKKNYLTLQPGVLMSYMILKRIKFSAGLNYYHGGSDVEVYNVSYTINNSPPTNATITNRGSFINYNFGLSYPFRLK